MSQKLEKLNIPKEVIVVVARLIESGFEAYLVGGCVRDLIMGRIPKDWDVTTNALPEQIISLFEKTVYENTFGTVGVCIPKWETVLDDRDYLIIEVTPYRLEGKYTDGRHPDEVRFSDNLLDDLKRRDFTMNSMAFAPNIVGNNASVETLEAPQMNPNGHLDLSVCGKFVDPYDGLETIKDKVIRTVGEPKDRFEEDGLRMLRAIRFSSELGFTISKETFDGVIHSHKIISKISTERIRDEFVKIIMSPEPMVGIAMLQKTGMLKYIIPELEQGIGCEQGGAHKYDVYEHLLQALQHAADKNWPLEIRMSALFHDIGKPKTRRKGIKKAYTFYGHEVVGARMTKVILERMKFPRETIDLATNLVRYHMFFSDTEQITLSAVRRIVRNVGVENIWTLMNVRECDRVGMAKVEAPYRLRKYHAMIEQVLRDPISVGQLVVDGNILMKELGVKAGPRMGWILNSLLEEVLDDPAKNTRDYLDKRVGELNQLSDEELKTFGEKAKQVKEEAEEKELGEIHKKHGVKK